MVRRGTIVCPSSPLIRKRELNPLNKVLVSNFKDYFKKEGLLNVVSPLMKKDSGVSGNFLLKGTKMNKIKYENSFSCKDTDKNIDEMNSRKESDNSSTNSKIRNKNFNDDSLGFSSNMSMKKIELFK